MEQRVLKYLSRIEGFKTRMKEIHWAEKTISGHELAGEIEDDLKSYQDSIAEDFQGIFGVDIKPRQLKPIAAKATTMTELINEIIKVTMSFYRGLKGDKYVGVRSEIEGFVHGMNIKKYLVKKTIKEDRERAEIINRIINESIDKTIEKSGNSLNEGKNGSVLVNSYGLSELVSESTKVAMDNIDEELGTFGFGVIGGKLRDWFDVEKVEISTYEGKVCLKCFVKRWFGSNDEFVLFKGGAGVNLDQSATKSKNFTWKTVRAKKTSFAANVLGGAAIGVLGGLGLKYIGGKLAGLIGTGAASTAGTTAAGAAGSTAASAAGSTAATAAGSTAATAAGSTAATAAGAASKGGKFATFGKKLLNGAGLLGGGYLLGKNDTDDSQELNEGLGVWGAAAGALIGGFRAIRMNRGSIIYKSDGTFASANGKVSGIWSEEAAVPETDSNETPGGGGSDSDSTVPSVTPDEKPKPSKKPAPKRKDRDVPVVDRTPKNTPKKEPIPNQGDGEVPAVDFETEPQKETPRERRKARKQRNLDNRIDRQDKQNTKRRERIERRDDRKDARDDRYDARTEDMKQQGKSEKRIDYREKNSEKRRARHDRQNEKAIERQDRREKKQAERNQKKQDKINSME